ncbi:MAG: glutathione binding-like protein [Alphaproteobacteria bacterium]
MLTLYFCPTPNCQKVTIMLKAINAAFDTHKIDILAGDQNEPDFVAICPNKKVPVLVDPDFTGLDGKPLAIWESGAILIHLAEKSGQYLSADPAIRAETLKWVMWQMSYLGPMMGQLHHFVMYAPEEVPYAIDRYMSEVHRLRALLNDTLETRAFIAGDEMSIADFAIYPWVKLFGMRYEPDRPLPHMEAWFTRMEEYAFVTEGLFHQVDTIRPEVVGNAPITDEHRSALFASYQAKRQD